MAKTIIVKGDLIKCNRGAKEWKGQKTKEKLFMTLASVELDADTKAIIEDAFKESGKKFTPSWVSDFEGYVNLSTVYEMPYKDTVNNVQGASVEEYITEGFNWLGAKVSVSVNVKEGALYPKAIIIHEEGKEFDPFADFDEDNANTPLEK